jgi:hypothetical protein
MGPATETDDPILPREPPDDLRGRDLINWKHAERNRQRRAYVIHEAGFLLDGGVRQDEITALLDYASVSSLQASLARWGREGDAEAARLAPRFVASAWNVYAQSGMGRGKDVR